MSCNKTLLGFDIASQQVACVNYRVNPVNYYLNCNINTEPDEVIQCSAFTDSGCTVFLNTNGYFAYDNYFRPYSPSTPNPGIYQRDFCLTSSYVKRCCGIDDTIYFAQGLSVFLNYVAPVGMVIDLEVTDNTNFNVFRECFEVVTAPIISVSTLTVNNVFGKYGIDDCDVCKNTNPNCYLPDGNFTFQNCKTGSQIVLTIDEANIIKVGDVVSFSGECYSATTIPSTLPSSGSTGPVLAGGCNNSFCKPTPPVTVQSEYVSGCCDGRVYKLISGNKYNVGFTLSVEPSNFCYTVINKPASTVVVYDLIDLGGITITTGCNSLECQTCPPGPQPIPTGSGPTADPCNPITIFDMGIKCLAVDPDFTQIPPTFGLLSVAVTGGTQPYTYTWTTPQGTKINKQNLISLTGGTYQIEVRDKYGDYIKKEFCSLKEIKNCNFEAIIKSIPTTDCQKITAIQGYCFS